MENVKEIFSQLPESSRVWIYQCNRELTKDEANIIREKIAEFVKQWTSHSRQVIADGDVFYDRFIVLVADESAFTVSGCSIDSSVGFIRQLEQQHNLSLFDRLNVAYRENGSIKALDQKAFQQVIDEGDVGSDTMVFNNLVSTLKDFKDKWEVPLSSSWHQRFFRLPV